MFTLSREDSEADRKFSAPYKFTRLEGCARASRSNNLDEAFQLINSRNGNINKADFSAAYVAVCALFQIHYCFTSQ